MGALQRRRLEGQATVAAGGLVVCSSASALRLVGDSRLGVQLFGAPGRSDGIYDWADRASGKPPGQDMPAAATKNASPYNVIYKPASRQTRSSKFCTSAVTSSVHEAHALRFTQPNCQYQEHLCRILTWYTHTTSEGKQITQRSDNEEHGAAKGCEDKPMRSNRKGP